LWQGAFSESAALQMDRPADRPSGFALLNPEIEPKKSPEESGLFSQPT